MNREWIIAKFEDMTRETLNDRDLIRWRRGRAFPKGQGGVLEKALE